MTPVDDDRTVATVAGLLGDDCARTILEATTTEPRSAEELEERCDVSLPTIYRRLETLVEFDLLEEHTRADPDGHHYTVYEARVERVVLELEDDGFSIRVTRRDRMADRFTQFVEDVR